MEDWLVGFVDGEGCFNVSVQVIGKRAYVRFYFSVVQNELPLLEQCRDFLKVGAVYSRGAGQWVWTTRNKADIITIITFFTQHPLRSKKRKDFELWAEAYQRFGQGSIKSADAAKAIDVIRAQMNSKGKLTRHTAVNLYERTLQ